MKRALVVALLTLGVTGMDSPARAAVITLAADQAGTDCTVSQGSVGEIVTIYTILRFNPGATGVAFRAPLPPDAGFTFIADQTSFLTLGNTQTGLQVGFGSCLSGDVLVIQSLFIRVGSGPACVPYRLLAHPIYTTPIVTDCSFVELPAFAEGVMLNADASCNGAVPPANPVPANGAGGVSPTPILKWDETEWICQMPLIGPTMLYLGTTPEPPLVGEASSPYSITARLEPETTYYWRVASKGIPGPLWSFTTGGPLQVVPTTWGVVKSLYR